MSSSEAAPATTPSTQDELEKAILKQIEFYFSRQNLSTDAWLVSQMNNQMYVPIQTVAGFRKIRERTTDLDLIVKVMRSSSAVQVDATGKLVRPSFAVPRSTIILRDIPSGAPEADVRALFADSTRISSVHSDIGDTWFVSFEDESHAMEALDHLRTCNYQGNPIKARLKSENLLKIIMNYTAPAPAPAPAAPFVPHYTAAPFYPVPPMAQGYAPRHHAQHGPRGPRPMNKGRRPSRDQTFDQTQPYPQPGPALTTPAPVLSAAPGSAEPAPILSGPIQQAPAHGPRGKGRLPSGPKGNKPSLQAPAKPSTTLVVTAADFPPLPNKPAGTTGKSGYEGDFRKYEKTDLITIAQGVTDLKRPVPLPTSSDCPVVSDAPNTSLEIVKPLPKNEKGDDKIPPEAVKSFAQAAVAAKDTKSPVQPPVTTLVPTMLSPVPATTAQTSEKKESRKGHKSHSSTNGKSAKPADSTAAPASSSSPQQSEEDGFQVQNSRKNKSKKNFPLLGPSKSATETETETTQAPEPILKEVSTSTTTSAQETTTTTTNDSSASDDSGKKSWSSVVGKRQSSKGAKPAETAPAQAAPTSPAETTDTTATSTTSQ